MLLSYFFLRLSSPFASHLASSICEFSCSKSGLLSFWLLDCSSAMGLALYSNCCTKLTKTELKLVLRTSLGKSRMCLGIVAPHKNWANSFEKLLQL